jgi:hypothetical protein
MRTCEARVSHIMHLCVLLLLIVFTSCAVTARGIA